MLPAYSVAMCTYNGARYIEQQLDSIFQQTHRPAELVICDDGSVDGTLEIVERYAHLTRLVLVENPKNLGFIKNFEQALGLCQESFILLSDQDDVWLADRAEQQLQLLQAKPRVSLVFSDAYRVNAKLKTLTPDLWQCVHFSIANQQRFKNGEALAVLLRHNVVTGATVALKKSFLNEALPFSGNYPHDAWLGLKAAQNDAIDFIPEKLIQYRQHEANTLGAIHESWLKKVSKLLTGYRRNQFPPEFFLRLRAYQELLDEGTCTKQQSALISEVKSFQIFRLSIMNGHQNKIEALAMMLSYLKRHYYQHYAAGVSSLVKDFFRLVFKQASRGESFE